MGTGITGLKDETVKKFNLMKFIITDKEDKKIKSDEAMLRLLKLFEKEHKIDLNGVF